MMSGAEVLVGAGLSGVRRGQPLPLRPAGSVQVSAAVSLVENDEGGAVFVWGMAVSCWDTGDIVGRRLAAVQLVATGAATQVEVGAGFGAGEATVQRWIAAWRRDGINGLVPAQKGPRRPSKLTAEMVAGIKALRAGGASMDDIATATGVSRNSVSRALAEAPAEPLEAVASTPEDDAAPLTPLARPAPRDGERQAARRGELAEAPPVICEGASLPMAGALLILPALAATGLVACAEEVYDKAKAAFYGLRSLVLAMVFAALVGEARAEGLTRLDPVDVGRLLGLDRAPEVKTLRRRLERLAGAGRADQLMAALARRHVAAHPEATGVFYVDGHVRAYHGGAEIPKAHVTRMRLSMPAAVDTWVADAFGDGVLCWTAPPPASLVGELAKVVATIRDLVGPDRRPTIAFDRGGWSPKAFAELNAAGFDILTYRKQPLTPEPRRAFTEHTHKDEAGRAHRYWLADRRVRLAYKDGSRRRFFACRQVTRLDPDTGHQTQIVTTRTDAVAVVAHAMFSRWRQENFFRYLRAHYGLDALDSYATVADDLERSVPNPAKRPASARAGEARRRLAEIEDGFPERLPAELAAAHTDAVAHVESLNAAARGVPARVPLGELHPDAVVHHGERKRIHDAIRMATYNAETALARLLAPHYPRADDEARSLLREAMRSPADLQIVGNELHVRINPLSAPRRSRAVAALCEDLNSTDTAYPGTELVLRYSVKDA
ncbi:MAG TPA: helix-turn-helix domain-containing protein [Egibacteraceae bacterium]|nr:helix-turn-helix domain-containing protein [Egibacteraceae bacterium]